MHPRKWLENGPFLLQNVKGAKTLAADNEDIVAKLRLNFAAGKGNPSERCGQLAGRKREVHSPYETQARVETRALREGRKFTWKLRKTTRENGANFGAVK